MAQKLKSQDLMELFNAKIDLAIEKFDLNEKIIDTVNKKLEEIENSSIKVEYEPLEEVIIQNAKLFEKHREELEKISEKHSSKIKESSKKDSNYQLYFYGALTIFLFLCTAFLSYGIDQYHEKTVAEKEVKFFSKEAFRRNEYLKEKNLTEKYENWLESKRK